MIIQIDTREKPRAIENILETFKKREVQIIRSKLFVGDYMNLDNPKLVVDRKQSLLEVTVNVTQDHKRFISEIERANAVGIHIVFLVEHGYGIKSLSDVMNWRNPRLEVSPLAVSGERLYRIMSTIANNYDIEFVFCNKKETGEKIIELLGGV